MRNLNELSKEERLELYKKAIRIWKDYPGSEGFSTDLGLCNFFKKEYQILAYHLSQTKGCDEWYRHVHRRCSSDHTLGKYGTSKSRLEALREMKKDLMKIKLDDTPANRDLLRKLIEKKKKVKATITLGFFQSKYADSLLANDYEGYVVAISPDSGYCNWTNLAGKSMPSVRISSITLH